MVARQADLLLISSIAESKAISTTGADTSSNSKMFLCVTWVTLLCNYRHRTVGYWLVRTERGPRGCTDVWRRVLAKQRARPLLFEE